MLLEYLLIKTMLSVFYKIQLKNGVIIYAKEEKLQRVFGITTQVNNP